MLPRAHRARGKESGNTQHDNSRSTAWAPVVNAEVNYRHENHSETKKAYAVKRKPLIFMVPEAGIEPARPYERGILSP